MVVSIGVALAVASVLTYRTTYQKHLLNKRVDEISSILRYAKQLSFAENRVLHLKPHSKSQDWSQGMTLWEENQIIQAWSWKARSISIVWRGFQGEATLRFHPNLAKNTLNGRFMVQTGTYRAQVVLNRLGRIRKEI